MTLSILINGLSSESGSNSKTSRAAPPYLHRETFSNYKPFVRVANGIAELTIAAPLRGSEGP